MVKIKSITHKHYRGKIFDITLQNENSPYFYANDILTHNSLYPHLMIQANLYGHCKDTTIERPVWNGNNVWKVEGNYFSNKLAPVGELLKKWYHDRVEYKKVNDRREYTIKIIINTIYGLLDHPYYTLVYDKIAAGDCTRLGRQFIKYARKRFRDEGYRIAYSDTDSIFLVDPYNDKERMLKLKDTIIDEIKKTLPFPQPTFNMAIEDEISHMFFFKGGAEKINDDEMDEDDFINKPLGFMKKNYLYITKDNKVKIKNLGIMKKSTSKLTRKIFYDYLVPKILEEKNVKFSKAYIKNVMMELLENDLSLATLRKDVGDIKQYSKSMTGLQAQINIKYGAGIHFLIPNTRNIGVGKGKKYCTVEEFKQHKLKVSDIDLTNFWMELDYFIKPPITKNIFDYEI